MRHPGDTLTVDTASVGQQKMAHVADRAAPADTIQYLGVLPDVFPQAKVDVPDTLQRIEFTSFVPTGKLKLARFRSAREFAPGIEGTPLFRDPCSSDLLILIVLLFSFVALFVLSKTRHYFFQRIHDFFMVHGLYLSFGEHYPEEVLRIMPLDRLFIETDESKTTIRALYEKAAEIKQIDVAQLTAAIHENIKNVFFRH